MNTQSATDLVAFHRFLSEKVANGGASLSPEKAFDEWRELQPDPETDPEEIAAIQEAIDDFENGDTGVPFDEFDREFRKRATDPLRLARECAKVDPQLEQQFAEGRIDSDYDCNRP